LIYYRNKPHAIVIFEDILHEHKAVIVWSLVSGQ